MASTEEAQKSKSRLLLCSQRRDSVLAMQGAVLREAGYQVKIMAAKEGIRQLVQDTAFDILILNHTLSFADRKFLAGEAKRYQPQSGVLVLHHSGSLGNPDVDLAVDSRIGAKAMLGAVQRLEGMLHARSHHLADGDGTYFVVADSARNYTFVTDPVCELLGYDRAHLLEMRIDDVVDGATAVTSPLFQQFVSDRRQTGTITLRHRSGKTVPVKYWSKVEPDGCMVARWEPVGNG